MGDDTVTDTVDSPYMTMGAIFDRLCPYYLSLGMTWELFWDGDVSAAVSYRKAEEYRRQRKNEELWLQGAYIYHALCDVSPVLNAFAKAGTHPTPYLERPIPLTKEQTKNKEQIKQEKSDSMAKAFMEMFMVSHNKKFEEGGMTNG
jgi:hypothetical protein